MVTFSTSIRGGRSDRRCFARYCSERSRPVGRQQRVEIFLIGHSGQAGEHVAQVGERIFAVAFAGDDQRAEDGGAAAGYKLLTSFWGPPYCL